MRANEFLQNSKIIFEGGWETSVTQGTVINPAIVRIALNQVNSFVKDFNLWLSKQGKNKVQVGSPLGSTAYFETDPENKIYGDIDLQMIAEPIQGTTGQFANYYNKLVDEFIKETKPKNIYYEKPANGHVIFKLDKDNFVQIDLIWTLPTLKSWVKYRMTPERDVKGLIYGNLYSTLGEILGLAIQHSGIQMKVKDGKPINFQRGRKEDFVKTISTDISTFVLDLLNELYNQTYGNKSKPKVSDTLRKHPGLNVKDIKIVDLIKAIKGLADSFEINKMYGKGLLADFKNSNDFIEKFIKHYENKAIAAATATKFEKADSPAAQARAEDTKAKIFKGLKNVMDLFLKS